MADVLVETAVANWEPRFCSNGVEVSDYARITRDLEHWDDWCAAWCAGAEVHLELAEAALAQGHARSAGEFYARAATYFHFGKFLFVHEPDQAKAAHARAVDALRCGRGGEAEWTLAIRPEWDRVGEVVIDHLETMADVDSSRLGVWGVSLGGFYAARMASSDLPIKGTISLAGPYNMGASWKNLNPLTRHAFQVRTFSSTPEEAERRAWDITLEGYASKITTPLLVIVGKLDRLVPWQDGERLASEARGESELLLLDEGNHGGANVIYRHRPQGADWMAERLQVSSSA